MREAWFNQKTSVQWQSFSRCLPRILSLFGLVTLVYFPFFPTFCTGVCIAVLCPASSLYILSVTVEKAESLSFIWLVIRTQETPFNPVEQIVHHAEIMDCEIQAVNEWEFVLSPFCGGVGVGDILYTWKEGRHRYLVRKRPNCAETASCSPELAFSFFHVNWTPGFLSKWCFSASL